MYLYTALPWRKAPRLGPWPRPGLERSVRALGALGVGALRPHVCIAIRAVMHNAFNIECIIENSTVIIMHINNNNS